MAPLLMVFCLIHDFLCKVWGLQNLLYSSRRIYANNCWFFLLKIDKQVLKIWVKKKQFASSEIVFDILDIWVIGQGEL